MGEPFRHQRKEIQPLRKFLKILNSFWEVWVRENWPESGLNSPLPSLKSDSASPKSH